MSDTKKRLVEYCKYKKISRRTFSKTLGLSPPYLSFKGSVDSDTLKKIDEIYPDLNLYWAITEKGAMINQESLPHEPAYGQLSNPADTHDIMNLNMPTEQTFFILREKISFLMKETAIQKEIIKRQNDIIAKSNLRH